MLGPLALSLCSDVHGGDPVHPLVHLQLVAPQRGGVGGSLAQQGDAWECVDVTAGLRDKREDENQQAPVVSAASCPMPPVLLSFSPGAPHSLAQALTSPLSCSTFSSLGERVRSSLRVFVAVRSPDARELDSRCISCRVALGRER